MATNLESYSAEELEKLIADAQRELEKRRRERRNEVMDEVRRLASTVGVKVEVVDEGGPQRRTRTKTAPKFRNPDDVSQTWTGRGPKPRWFKDALSRGIPESQMLI